jgi:hypothetical protein
MANCSTASIMDQPWPTAFSMATLKSSCFLTMPSVCVIQEWSKKYDSNFYFNLAFQDKVKDYIEAQVGEKGTRINIPDKRLQILIPLSGECARNLCDKGDGWIEPTKVRANLINLRIFNKLFLKISQTVCKSV